MKRKFWILYNLGIAVFAYGGAGVAAVRGDVSLTIFSMGTAFFFFAFASAFAHNKRQTEPATDGVA